MCFTKHKTSTFRKVQSMLDFLWTLIEKFLKAFLERFYLFLKMWFLLFTSFPQFFQTMCVIDQPGRLQMKLPASQKQNVSEQKYSNRKLKIFQFISYHKYHFSIHLQLSRICNVYFVLISCLVYCRLHFNKKTGKKSILKGRTQRTRDFVCRQY